MPEEGEKCMNTQLQKNVRNFLDESSEIIGRAHAEAASMELFMACTDLQSPIEQLFLIAFHALAESNWHRVRHHTEATENDLVIIPQAQVGKYRVDFKAYCQPQAGIDPNSFIAIECDGHAFHDQDKHQRSYEKRRDRALQRHGMKVFRFTGSDIVKDPYLCAAEVVAALTGRTEQEALTGLEEFRGGK